MTYIIKVMTTKDQEIIKNHRKIVGAYTHTHVRKAGSSDHCNEHSGTIKGRKFIINCKRF
jgi:hypothetical protein